MDENPVLCAVDRPSGSAPTQSAQVRFLHEERDGEATLVVIGEIDIAVTGEFREQLHSLIEAAHSPALIDVSKLSFVDSSGLSVLLNAKNRADLADVSLVLVGPSPFVRRVLDVTGLSSVFDVRAH